LVIYYINIIPNYLKYGIFILNKYIKYNYIVEFNWIENSLS